MSLLELAGVSRSFGGMTAVQKVSFTVQPGEIIGVIGANGAGKSTLYNLIAGALPVTSGVIRFRGRDITRLPSHRVARLGLGRTFQIPTPFRHLTVVENVMLGALHRHARPAAARAAALGVLEETGLASYAYASIAVLTVGLLKRLEVARALAGSPSLVLFDEILAGLTPTEIRQVTALIAALPGRGVTVLWVEHVLHAIMGTAERILVMNRGSLIADGPPADIVRNPEVISSYLGEEMALA